MVSKLEESQSGQTKAPICQRRTMNCRVGSEVLKVPGEKVRRQLYRFPFPPRGLFSRYL